MKKPFQRGPRGTYRPAAKEARRTEKTGWDEMAPWYSGWAGAGHIFHKTVAFPALVPLLNLKRGMRVVDLACGFGVLRDVVEKVGAEYVGIDKSPTMIRKAKEDALKVRSGAHFYISDVALPGGIKIPEAKPFDRAVFIFSIQDIDNLKDAVKNATKFLNANGELLIFMVHPAFRIPRQSGWGKDEGRKLTYRRVDRYKSEVTIPLPQRTGGETQVTSFFYHRPLQSYADALKESGMLIAEIKEVYTGTKNMETEFPHFMIIRAVKR